MSAIVEQHSGGKLERDEAALVRALSARGQEWTKAPLSWLRRNKTDTRQATLVAGSIPFAEAALRQRGRELPEIDCYPAILNEFMLREVKKSTLDAVVSHLESRGTPLFVKPSARTKRFTGFVLDNPFDPRLGGVARRERVYVCDPVAFVSEWRVYVVHKVVRSVISYDGRIDLSPDTDVIAAAVSVLASDSTSPGCYAIDFGLLADGRTALVEMNDGFSVGAYHGLDDEVYLSMIEGRWHEMTS